MSRKTDDIERRKQLLKAFGGDVSGWEYTGMTDAGAGATQSMNPPKCPCGHPIRYICNWEHKDGRKTHTGNVCVMTIPELAGVNIEKMENDLRRLIEKENQQKKEQRIENQKVEIQELINECLTLSNIRYQLSEEKVKTLRPSWQLDYSVYNNLCNWKRVRYLIKEALKLKSLKGKINRLAKIKQSME